MAKKILLILADGFEEIEALGTADVLRRIGAEVVIAGVHAGAVTGAHNMPVIPDVLLADVKKEIFDAVVLPGGMPGAANLDNSSDVSEVLSAANAGNKVIAAICAAPFILAKRGLLDGRRFTMYPGFDAMLNGLQYTDALAEIDGNIVTGKGPGAVFEFTRGIAVSLGMEKECEKVYQGMFIQ